MAKMKRYNGEDDSVTSDGKDYGGSSGTGDYAPEDTEAKGDAMLKDMRDEAAKARPKPKAMAKATPKVTPKAAPISAAKETSKPAAPTDVTKMSANERTKQSIENNLASARAGSGPTDTRSVGERLRSAFGVGKKGSGNTVDFGGSGMGMAKGGSASSRADGIATKGKTRGKMC